MKIALGSDHAGFKHKQQIKDWLNNLGYATVDCGCFSEESCDYPDYAKEVAILVASNKCEKGILFCRTGIGMSIVANKFKKIRAAVCFNLQTASLASAHTNANIICLPSDFLEIGLIKQMIETWLKTPFEEGRHLRRIKKIEKLERKCNSSIGRVFR